MIQARINPRKAARLTIYVCGMGVLSLVALLSSAGGDGTSTKSTVQVDNAQQHPGAKELDWHKVDAGPFSIVAPLGWEFHQLESVDSYAGKFVGSDIVLRSDFGEYANLLKEENKSVYAVSYKLIGGRRAKIVSPRTPGIGITGIYFRNAGHSSSLTIFGHHLTAVQQELVLKIFDTLRFGGPVPRYTLPPPPARNVQ